ncbi:MAG: two-component system sensor histidine kinase DcuS [Veillonellaceae bacterium]|jgi:CitB family two-component system sensor histidine kinase MalK|nr:two-component system sensor histidine kinase DcuS [Veillonellaceae bacterium]
MRIKFTLKTKIIFLVLSVVAIILIVTSLLISRSIAYEVKDSIGRQALSIARIIAHSPIVIEGLAGKRDIPEIQHYANDAKLMANVQFIVVLDMNGIRLSHPLPSLIGQHLVGGDELEALKGNEYLSEAVGTMGYSLRAFTPVYGPDGKQIGVVLVGILMKYVHDAVTKAQMILFLTMLIGMIIGILGALYLARDIKATLHGLEPEVIAKKLEERNVILQSVREAIIAIDISGRITLINEEGSRLLRFSGVTTDPLGRHITEFIPSTRLIEVVKTGNLELNQEVNFFGSSILVNNVPLVVDGIIVGAVATFRDKTEVKQLAEELTGVRDYVDALRAQSHEFMNQLHVILGLVQLENYDLLASYIHRIAGEHQAEVTYVGRRIRNPVIAGFILSKLSMAREKNITIKLHEDSFLPEVNNEEITHELVTIIGNLVENAFDSVLQNPKKEVELFINYNANLISIEVSDSGCGINPELGEHIYNFGVSTKSAQRGIGLHLVKLSLGRLNGNIDYVRKNGRTIFKVLIPYESVG